MLHTWLSQQDGVVLGAPAEDLNYTSHLTLTADDLQDCSNQAVAASAEWHMQA
jgi:multimeric flavodoxin WrbA